MEGGTIMMLLDQLKEDEGFRPKPYLCTGGYWTIGYGRNLETNPLTAEEKAMIFGAGDDRDLWERGLTRDEAETLLKNDIARVRADLESHLPVYTTLDKVRRDAVANMRFQLGMKGLEGFKNMLAALERQDWAEAAREGLDSKWAKRDTPNRAQRVTRQLRTGVYPS